MNKQLPSIREQLEAADSAQHEFKRQLKKEIISDITLTLHNLERRYRQRGHEWEHDHVKAAFACDLARMLQDSFK